MIKDTLITDVDLFLVQPLLVSRWQGVIRHNLQKALAGQKGSPDAMQNLITAVHQGEIQAWVGVTGEEDNRRTIGMVFTRVMGDSLLGTKVLLIYGLNIEAKVAPIAFSKSLAVLEEYAKKRGCHALSAQTSVNGVARILEGNGWTNGVKTLRKDL